MQVDKVDKLELEKYSTFGRLLTQTSWSDKELEYVLLHFKRLVELLTHMPDYELARRAAMQDYMKYESMWDLRKHMQQLEKHDSNSQA